MGAGLGGPEETGVTRGRVRGAQEVGPGESRGNGGSPGLWGRGFLGAEAEGFEPSMGGKPQTALAVRRHRPD